MPAIHPPGKLAGDGPPGPVNQRLRQDDRRRHPWARVPVAGQVADHRRHARQVVKRRPVRVEPARAHVVASQHHVVAERVVVARVRERAEKRELVAPPGQFGQVLADLHAGRDGVDRCELAPDPRRSVGLEVPGLVLRRSARLEQVDHRSCPRRRVGLGLGVAPEQVAKPEPSQAQSTNLEEMAPPQPGMRQGNRGDPSHASNASGRKRDTGTLIGYFTSHRRRGPNFLLNEAKVIRAPAPARPAQAGLGPEVSLDPQKAVVLGQSFRSVRAEGRS